MIKIERIVSLVSMNLRFLAVVFVLASLQASAQNLDLVDSLRSRINTASPELQFELLSGISFEYRYSFPDSSISYGTRAYNLGKSIGMKSNLSKPLSFIGLAYTNKGDYQNALVYHLQSIDVAIEQDDTLELAYGYNNLGRMFFDQGDHARALDNLVRSKELFEELNEKSGLAYVHRSLANVHSLQHDYAKALEMSRTAYVLRQEIGDPRMIVSSLMELGIIHEAAGDTESALRSFLMADSVSTTVNDPVTRAELSMGLAEILFSEGNMEDSYRRASEVLTIISEKTNQRLYLRAIFLQAGYLLSKKRYNESEVLMQRVLTLSEGSGNVQFQRDASKALSEIYAFKKDPARASQYDHLYRIFAEKLQNTDLSRQIERLQFQVEIEKRDRENELLKVNDAKNKALISKQRFQNILLIIVIGSIGIIAAITWTNSRRRRLVNHKLSVQNKHIVNQREEIAKQNEELSRSNTVLYDLNQEKDTLMNIVAHDLKSPLNRISGLVGILELSNGVNTEQKQYLKLIREATRSGLDLITDLLDVNALEEVRTEPQFTKVSMREILEERAGMLQVAAREKLIQIVVSCEISEPVQSDRSYLGRIIDNLLTNAIKFSPKGSQVLIAAYAEGNCLMISVKDNGPGFLPTDRQFLFQKFKKLSARPTGGESSNGLGLAIVKTLVDRLKGRIDLKSDIGKGSEFVISLPL
jgi:signal transduction histidine kinase